MKINTSLAIFETHKIRRYFDEKTIKKDKNYEQTR